MAAQKRGEWHEAARLIHARNPDMNCAQIADLFGVTQSAVWKVLNPEANRAWVARDNRLRRDYKSAWQHQRDRDPEVRGRCSNAVCGGLLGIGHGRAEMCRGCRLSIAEVRRTLAEGMWADGWTVRELGQVFGISKDHMGVRIATWRQRGYAACFPHRRTAEQVQRIRAGWAQARAATQEKAA